MKELPFKIIPWGHQLEGIEIGRNRDFFGYFLDMGCISGDAVISYNRAGITRKTSLRTFYKRFNTSTRWHRNIETKVKSLFPNGIYKLNTVKKVLYSGEKEVWKIILESGKEIEATKTHKFLRQEKMFSIWRGLDKLKIGEKIATNGEAACYDCGSTKKIIIKSTSKHKGLCVICSRIGKRNGNYRTGKTKDNDGYILLSGCEGYRQKFEHVDIMEKHLGRKIITKKEQVHHINGNPSDNRLENLMLVTPGEHNILHDRHTNLSGKTGKGGEICFIPKWEKIKSIKKVGVKDTYDLVMSEPARNFVANKILVHNSGKTLVSINVLRYIFLKHKAVLPTLILCPLIVMENWRREIIANAGDAVIKAMQIVGRQKNNSSKLKIKQLLTPGKQIFVVNLDTVNTDAWKQICKMKWNVLIIDESHKFRGPKAERTKKLIKLADTIKYKYILSGRPILNKPDDIWAQFRILNKDIFPSNFWVFQTEYFYDKNAWMKGRKDKENQYFPDWRPHPGSLERLQKIISENSMRRTKEEVMKFLPPHIRKIVYVEMTPEQEKHYNEMEQDFITYVGNKACVAEIAALKTMRLQQLSVGIVKLEDKTVVKIPTLKIKALKELLQDILIDDNRKETSRPQNKVIIWTNFVDTYDDIKIVCDELKLKYSMVVGSQKTDRQQQIDSFNNDDSIRVMIANQQAGGEGIGLQAANYAIYYGKNGRLDFDEQSQARNHRGGSEIHEKIFRIDLVIQGTVDELVNESLKQKKLMGDFLLTAAEDLKRIKEQYAD